MENIENKINFASKIKFSDDLLNDLEKYRELSKNKENKEEVKSYLKKVKEEYKTKLSPELDSVIKEEIENAKKTHEEALKAIEEEKNNHLKTIEDKFNARSEEEKSDKAIKKEHDDSIKGALIVAKRARIKENNNFDLVLKDTKLQKIDLYEDYCQIVKYVLNKKSLASESLTVSYYENKANFNLKKTLKSKQTWFNLMPLFMLILLICAFYISNSITGYKGNITDVINNGVFVAVVATGAVFIYSQGSFDMSLGPASLMCATLAAITWNATGNIVLSFFISIIVGCLLGIVNAILANVLGLPVMVMTLTMMNILNSIHAVILQQEGNQLNVKNGLPATTIVYATFLVCFFLLLWAIFNYTKIGRRNKFIGSNQVAAKFSGVSLMKAGIISFAISGVGLGICGFLFASYNSGSSFSTGTILDTIGLNVVIAIVFGGMTTSGGPRSRVSCAIIGAFFCVFLDELFRSIGAADARFLAKGIVFLIVSLINMWSSRPKMLAR